MSAAKEHNQYCRDDWQMYFGDGPRGMGPAGDGCVCVLDPDRAADSDEIPGSSVHVDSESVHFAKQEALLAAKVESLRTQLAEVTRERDEAREQAARYPVPAVATDLHDMVADALRPHLNHTHDEGGECWEVTDAGASGLADIAIEALISAARLPGVADDHVMFEYRHARDQVERFAERINAAEARLSSALKVVEAAKAWVNAGGGGQSRDRWTPTNAEDELEDAVNAYHQQEATSGRIETVVVGDQVLTFDTQEGE